MPKPDHDAVDRDAAAALVAPGARRFVAASQFGGAAQAAGPGGSQIDPGQALSTAHQAAGWAALALGLTVAASAAGGAVGQTLRRRS